MIGHNASGILLKRGSLALKIQTFRFQRPKPHCCPFACALVNRNRHVIHRSWQSQAYAKTTKQKLVGSSQQPGSKAFTECETDAIKDLFHVFAKPTVVEEEEDGSDTAGRGGTAIQCLDHNGVRELLKSIGEHPDERTLRRMFKAADLNGDGVIELDEFLACADTFLGDAPARIVLVVGGPGSGKGLLCSRLEEECNVVHLSSGDMLRDEVNRGTPLGRECAEIMKQGGLVSSAVIVTLIRRHMRGHPGKRVLLDGFPRSPDNAHDLIELCGVPELALHLDCDDTILLERIIGRGRKGQEMGDARADDNFDTALERLRTFHRHHQPTIQWLKDHHVPIVNLDCGGSPESVWNQLLAIGRLMRPAVKHSVDDDSSSSTSLHDDEPFVI